MPPRTGTADERRLQILQAAAACFADKGYHRTTMDEIVLASGLSKGTLYWYFDSKKALFLALAEHLFDEIGLQITELEHASLPAATRVQAINRMFVSMMQQYGELLPLMLEFWGTTFKEDEMLTLTRSMYENYRVEVSRVVQSGIDSGEFQAVNSLEVAALLIGAADGLMVQWLIAPEAFDLSSAVDTLTQVVLHGLLGSAQPQPLEG